MREGSKVSRSEQVASHFPRLAYTTSDVIVMVAREPFYNRRYLDRCIQLAKRANSGVANVQRPALVLVGNKLPGDEVVLDVDASTTAFFDCWGDDAQELDSFFSAILCVYVPHKSSVWTDPDDPTRTLDGATACELQLGKRNADPLTSCIVHQVVDSQFQTSDHTCKSISTLLCC